MSLKHRPERDREVFAVLRLIRGRTPEEVGQKSGISPQTIRNWRKSIERGGTRYPQHWTLSRVARAYGHRYELVEVEARATKGTVAEHRIN